MTPLISVIVISYNDAARLPRAIASVQRQSLKSLEIVVVDDASTDDTADVVSAIAAQDPRVRYVRLPVNSGGCSGPRNRGLEVATADWVMFCDSDDEYEPHACANLLRAVEESGADIACGTAERIDVQAGKAKRWRPELHDSYRVVDRLTDLTDLLYDTISVNKVYRRSLLERHGLRFPEGLLFEDQLFTLEAMAFAKGIAVIPETVYRWYVARQAEVLSITQSRKELRNVEDRIEINRRIDAFLAVQGSQRLSRAKELKFLKHDLWLYLSSILESDDATAQAIVDVLQPYVAGLDLARCWEIAPLLRVAVYHLLLGDIDGIRAAMTYVRWSSSVARPVVVRDGREIWGCSHSAAGPEFAGVDAAAWLDVTAAGIARIPFSQRRYLHVLDDLSVTGDEVTLRGSSVDYDGLLDGADSVELRLMVGAQRTMSVLPVEPAEGGRWTATGTLVSSVRGPIDTGVAGGVVLAVRRGDLVNSSPIRVHGSLTAEVGGALPVRFGVGEAAAVTWLTTVQRPAATPARGRISTAARRRIQRVWGRVLRPRDTVVLTANPGFGGDVGAVAQALAQRHPEWKQVWSVRPTIDTVPDGVDVVVRGTSEHEWAMARAGVVLTDGAVPDRTGDRALVVRVGLGVPVHHVGLDDPDILTDRAAMRALKRESQRWNLLAAPTAAAGRRLARAYAFRGTVVAAGLPSMLDLEIDALRARLDLPTYRSIVVYAPARRGEERTLIDLERWAHELGSLVYLVVAAPKGEPIEVPTRLRAFARTVAGDDAVLSAIAASDLVVSDYSHWIGAAAALDRDIVLFQPDRRDFVDREHGVYPEFASVGPKVGEQPDLIDEVRGWLADPAPWRARWAPARRAWAQEWSGAADGAAAARIVDAIEEARS
jgi:CDP-glycerol glycerophosphotransferase